MIVPFIGRSVAIRAGPSSPLSVSIQRAGVSDDDSCGSALSDKKWSVLKRDPSVVDWERMPGGTFAQKLFLLLAVEMSTHS